MDDIYSLGSKLAYVGKTLAKNEKMYCLLIVINEHALVAHCVWLVPLYFSSNSEGSKYRIISHAPFLNATL
jgi:hypothetical protein